MTDITNTLENALPSSSSTAQPQMQTNLVSHSEEVDQSVTYMIRSFYEAAQVGDYDVLRRTDGLVLSQLTPCANTILHVYAQFHDKAECVNEVLVMQSFNVKQSLLTWKNLKNETALHIAARAGRLDIARALIDQAKSLDRENLEGNNGIAERMMRTTDQNGDTTLHVAVRNRHVEMVKLIVEEDPEFEHPLNKMEETPLYLAVENDNKGMVNTILTVCKSPTYSGPGRRTALHAAIINNSEDCTKMMLKFMQHLTKEVDDIGWSPLHYAANCNWVPRAIQLLEADRSAAYIKAYKDDNKTPLLVAACTRDESQTMKEILKYCPDCWEMTTSKDQNVLHLAIYMDHSKVVKFILSNSWAANLINEMDDEGNTPIHLYVVSLTLTQSHLVKHPEVNTNVYNRENLTPLDISNGDHKRDFHLKRNGAKEGTRKIVESYSLILKQRKELLLENTEEQKTDDGKISDTHLIVATLIATVTFAAGFTVPGGYDGNDGSNQGMAILAKKVAFKTFVVFNTTALISSIIAVFLYYKAVLYRDKLSVTKHMFFAMKLVMIAMIAMMVSFMTGLYVVLAPSSLGLAISVCVFGSVPILMILRTLREYF